MFTAVFDGVVGACAARSSISIYIGKFDQSGYNFSFLGSFSHMSELWRTRSKSCGGLTLKFIIIQTWPTRLVSKTD